MNSDGQESGQVSARTLEQILELTVKLAQPFDLNELLEQVVDAGRELLDADRGTAFMYDEESDELVAAVATSAKELRFPADRGIVGEAARTRSVVNVPDCYSDPRFNPDADRQSGYRTRCLLSVPLIGGDDRLVGVSRRPILTHFAMEREEHREEACTIYRA